MAEVFQPIRGLEERIQSLPVREGFLYFAYDSGNIYLDKNGHRYLMGGSGSGSSSGASGIIYAHGTDDNIIKLVPEDDDDYTYSIAAEALDDGLILPHQDNLILNSDGRFFRVQSVDSESNLIYAILLAVSGTGDGGGGGSSNVLDLDLTWTGIDLLGSTFIYGKSTEITFIPDSTADEICSLTITVTNS